MKSATRLANEDELVYRDVNRAARQPLTARPSVQTFNVAMCRVQVFQSSCGNVELTGRVLATTLVVCSALGLYFFISLGQSTSATTVVMPSWVPFWPSFTLPYLGMLLVTWLLPVCVRDGERFRACLQAMICAFLLVVPWWILIPTRLDRPSAPEAWWTVPYYWLTVIDPPHCVMPCAHGIGAMIAAWFVAVERPSWRWPLVAMLLLGLPSIAFVWQHRPLDILIGCTAATIGIVVAEAMLYRKKRRLII